jgi:SAM-dependent methyltransferase
MQDMIEADAAYACSIARNVLFWLNDWGRPPIGLSILELGPGRNLACALILAGEGANVTVADRFLCDWQDDYHPAVYRRMLELWEGPAPLVEAALKTGRHPLRMLKAPAEALAGIRDGEMDVVLSNAVLEHVYDLQAVLRELFRVAKPGGIQFHQIDFRDHRDFTRPLEFLLLDDREYEAQLIDRHWDHGNRVRPGEVLRWAQEDGFMVLSTMTTNAIDMPYLLELLPRLRSSGTRYAKWPAVDLHMLGGFFVLSKPTGHVRSDR